MPFPLAHRDGFVSFDDPDDFCGDVTRFAILFTDHLSPSQRTTWR